MESPTAAEQAGVDESQVPVETSTVRAQPDPPSNQATDNADAQRPEFEDYPELEAVLTLALDSVVGPFALADDEERLRFVEDATVAALVADYAPVAAAARETADRTEKARVDEATAVAEAAELLATHTQETATALLDRGHETAQKSAADASQKAERVAAEVPAGEEVEAADQAALTRRGVQQQAATVVAEWAEMAAMAKYSVGLAVARVGAAADSAAMAAELDAVDSAWEIESTALDRCYRVALAAAVKAAATATSATTDRA